MACSRFLGVPPRTGKWLSLLLALAFLVSPAGPAFGQASSAGEIVGTVTDGGSGAPLAGVHVTAQSPSGRFESTTDSRGVYSILGVLPDTYSVSFQRSGYAPASLAGVTVIAGSVIHVNEPMRRDIKVIASTHSRSVGSAFQPGMTTDTYTITGPKIQLVQGKDFNTDENSLLRSIPSVTVDKSGTISIRGGFAFEAGYEYEGIDYTTPTPNLQNTLQNISNFSLLNGVGGVQLIPGGGDALHGNTGTGLILLTAKHGTYPGYATLDLESGAPTFDHQLGFEWGIADPKGRLSNYFSYIGVRQNYQYGFVSASANTLGTRGTNAATLGTTVDPNLVFFSPSFLGSNDFVDNLIYRFGRNGSQRLQFFFQGQAVKQDLDYGGYQGLQYVSGGPGLAPLQGTCPVTPPVGTPDQPANSPAQNIFCQRIMPLYPGQPSASAFVTQPDRLYSPLTTYKVEYDLAPSSSTFLATRFYRAFTQQSQELPTQGVLADPYGGIRSGVSTDATIQAGAKHLIKTGLKYEFSIPFGDRIDATSYTAFTNPQGILFGIQHPGQPIPIALAATLPNYNPFTPNGLELDFLNSGECTQLAITSRCGYLSSYFPGGVRMPVERDVPTVAQQVYGVYLQDDVTFNDRYKSEIGLRYDGFNFLQQSDSTDPAGVAAVAHQRQLEPHLGLTYTAGRRDVIRAGFGHTLSVPLPGLIPENVDPRVYAPFANVPSYDNTTGKPAAYCGVTASSPCANYAQQLYWLTRDYRFGGQPLNGALHGATFTNYDISWAHEFRDGAALKLTPFYRRGYDVIEETSQVVGINPNTGAPIFGDVAYSNLGTQKATGVEFEYTKTAPIGVSVDVGATYINQIGNEPPGGYLSPTALAAGELYRSPDLSPFQATVALNDRTKSGFRIAPVLSFEWGYPYGAGYYAAVMCNGQAVVVPITNLTAPFTLSPNYVDPQNPGSCSQPNIAVTRGAQEPASAGGALSSHRYRLDLTMEYAPPGSRYTFGVQLQNVTNQIYNIPIYNTCWGIPVVTGLNYGSSPCTYSSAPYGRPDVVLSAPNSYSVYPNQTPLEARMYMQVKL